MDLAEAVKYVAAAYLVVWATIGLWVLLIGQKVGRMERELDELEARIAARDGAPAERVSEAPAHEPVA